MTVNFTKFFSKGLISQSRRFGRFAQSGFDFWPMTNVFAFQVGQ